MRNATVWIWAAALFGAAVCVAPAEGQFIYWMKGTTGVSGSSVVKRVDLSRRPLEIEPIADLGQGTSYAMALDATRNRIFFGRGEIEVATLSGASRRKVVPVSGTFLGGMAIDSRAGLMYWIERTDPQAIKRADLAGASIRTLVDDRVLGLPLFMALDVRGGKMYWTDIETDKIQRANLDGTGVENVRTTSLSHPAGIAFDESTGRLWCADSVDNRIVSMDTDGQSFQTERSNLDDPVGIALDAAGGMVYWTEETGKKIRRARMDGSGQIEDLLTQADGLARPLTLALNLPGACCLNEGCLSDLLPENCGVQLGGRYAGPGTSCASDVCDFGACCLACDRDGCDERLAFECALDGGDFMGAESVCSRCPPPSRIGACCIEGSCVPDRDERECVSVGGEWAGPCEPCRSFLCSRGACCFADLCGAMSEGECDMFFGRFAGLFSVCDEGVCPLCRGDGDRDGDVDLADAAVYLRCFRRDPTGSCNCADLDYDNGIDHRDYRRLAERMSGPR